METKKVNMKSLNLSKKDLKSFNKNIIQGEMKDILELNLEENHIESTDNLQQLVNLKYLNLSSNLIEKIGTLPKTLEILLISNNHISEIFYLKNNTTFISPFSSLIYLTKLNLSKNHISKLHPQIFSNCQSLSFIDLSHNKISDQLQCFTNLFNLKELNLSNNKISEIDVLHQLKSCKVSKLNLMGNKVVKQYPECERILKANLINLEDLQIHQDRCKTPQPKKNQNFEERKENNSAISNRNKALLSPLPDKHRKKTEDSIFYSYSSKRNLNNQFELELKNQTSQLSNQDEKKINTQKQLENTKQHSTNIFQSIPLFDQLSCDQQNNQSISTEYSIQSNIFATKELDIHKACDLKLQRMQLKQKLDEILIQQQVDMISNLTGNRPDISNNSKSFTEESLSYPEIKNEMNLIYMNAKFDIVLLAFSKMINASPIHIDQTVQKLINSKTFLSSKQKEEIADQLVTILIYNE